MAIPFAHVAEAVVMVLQGRGESGRHDEALLDNDLKVAAEVIPSRTQGLRVGCAGRREKRSGQCAAVAIFIRDPACDETRSSIAVVPEEPRPDDTAIVCGDVGPAVMINIVVLLPVTAP